VAPWPLESDACRVPLLVALSCDVREPGEYLADDIAGRPIVWSAATTASSAPS